MTPFRRMPGTFLSPFLLFVFVLAAACSSPETPAETTASATSSSLTEPTTLTTEPPSAASPNTAPSTASTATPLAPIDRIAFVSADGRVYTTNRDGSDRQLISPESPGGTFAPFYAWPVWSPDGRHMLLTGFTPDFAGGFATSLLRISTSAPGAVPELLYSDLPGTTGIGGGIPHFPLWHPDSGSVALIANVGDGLATFLIDAEDGIGPSVSNGGQVYLNWSSDGSHLVVHTAERLVLHRFAADGSSSGRQQIGNGSVSYKTPKFSPSADRYAYIETENGVRSLMVGGVEGLEPERIRPAGANNAFEWSPDGNRLAFAEGSRIGSYESLRIIDLSSEDAEDIVIGTNFLAFWWSPDGSKILLAIPGEERENIALAVADAQSSKTTFLGRLTVSPEISFVIEFFDQYSPDLNIWSPDSTSFVFSGSLLEGHWSPGGLNTQVQFGGGETDVWVFDAAGSEDPISLGSGVFGTWSPR